jgi:hypothetical protein
LVPGNDTLVVSAQIFRPENQLVKVQADITSFDKADIDSIPMFDNGVYPDNIAGDGYYTGYWAVTNSEADYNIDMSVYLSNYEYLILLEDAEYFTTKGPIKFESMEVTNGNPNPNPPERIKFTLTLRNEGITDTIYNVKVDLISDNPFIQNSGFGVPKFEDIPPGESRTSHTIDFALTFLEGCSEGEHEIRLQITSNDVHCWNETFTIDVITGIEDEESDLPTVFALEQNYPNPFNPSTTIKYAIPPSPSKGEGLREGFAVSLKVFNLLGQEITTLVNETQRPGYYEVIWDAIGQPSGVYFYKLTAGHFSETKKMILLR